MSRNLWQIFLMECLVDYEHFNDSTFNLVAIFEWFLLISWALFYCSLEVLRFRWKILEVYDERSIPGLRYLITSIIQNWKSSIKFFRRFSSQTNKNRHNSQPHVNFNDATKFSISISIINSNLYFSSLICNCTFNFLKIQKCKQVDQTFV